MFMQPKIYFAMKSMPCFYFSNTFYTYNQRGCNQSIALGCETGWYSHCSLCEIAQSLPPPLRTTDRAGVGELSKIYLYVVNRNKSGNLARSFIYHTAYKVKPPLLTGLILIKSSVCRSYLFT